MQVLLEPIASYLPEDGRYIVVQFCHHDGKPQLVVCLAEDVLKHEVLQECTCYLGRGGGGAKMKGVLLFLDELVVDAVAQLVRDGQDIVQLAGMVEEYVRGLRDEMMGAERAAVLAFPGIRVDLPVLNESFKDIGELIVKPFHHPMDEVYGFLVGIALGDFPVFDVPFVVSEFPDLE